MRIEAEHHNKLVRFYRSKMSTVDAMRNLVATYAPQHLPRFDSYYSALKALVDSLREVRAGDYVSAEDVNIFIDVALKALDLEWYVISGILGSPSDLASMHSQVASMVQRLERVASGDVVRWQHRWQHYEVASALDSLNKAVYDRLYSTLAVTTVYLFNQASSLTDFQNAMQYATDDCLVFIAQNISGVYGSHLAQYLSSYRIVFVNTVDTFPYYPYPMTTFRDVLYTIDAPYCTNYDSNSVVDPCFKSVIGSSSPANIDYFTPVSQKVSTAVSWAVYTGSSAYSWSYNRYGKGWVIEVPCDGSLDEPEWFLLFVDAISKCLLGRDRPRTIIYIGYKYAAGGSVVTWDVIKRAAKQRGWKIIDKTGG